MTLPLLPSISSYGSVAVMSDAVPVTNPSTQWSATSINPLRNDTTAMAQTSMKAKFQFLGTAGTPVIASTATWAAGFNSQWGSDPDFQPIFTNTGTGLVSVQMPATVPDFINGPGNLLNIIDVKAHVSSGTVCGQFICTVTSSSTFTMRMYAANGTSLSNLVGSLITVEVF